MAVEEATQRYYFPQREEIKFKAGPFLGSLRSLRMAGNGFLIGREVAWSPVSGAVLNHMCDFLGTEVFDVVLQKIGGLLCYCASKLSLKTPPSPCLFPFWSAVAMGCSLNKVEKHEEKRPGNIYSTLRRPQVETKVDVTYEYRFLEFTTLTAGESRAREGGWLRHRVGGQSRGLGFCICLCQRVAG